MPICFVDCSTADQTVQSLRLPPTFLLFDRPQKRPLLDTCRGLPSVEAVLDQTGDGDGPDASFLPSRSARTQRFSRSWIVSTSS